MYRNMLELLANQKESRCSRPEHYIPIMTMGLMGRRGLNMAHSIKNNDNLIVLTCKAASEKNVFNLLIRSTSVDLHFNYIFVIIQLIRLDNSVSVHHF